MGAKRKEMERLVKIFPNILSSMKVLNCYIQISWTAIFYVEMNRYRKDFEETGCYFEPEEFCKKIFEIIAQD